MTGLANPVGGKFIKSRRAKSSYTTRRHSEDFLNSSAGKLADLFS